MILHIQKQCCNELHAQKTTGPILLLVTSNWCKLYKQSVVFSLNFWSYLLTTFHHNWNQSLNPSRRCRRSGWCNALLVIAEIWR